MGLVRNTLTSPSPHVIMSFTPCKKWPLVAGRTVFFTGDSQMQARAWAACGLPQPYPYGLALCGERTRALADAAASGGPASLPAESQAAPEHGL